LIKSTNYLYASNIVSKRIFYALLFDAVTEFTQEA